MVRSSHFRAGPVRVSLPFPYATFIGSSFERYSPTYGTIALADSSSQRLGLDLELLADDERLGFLRRRRYCLRDREGLKTSCISDRLYAINCDTLLGLASC